MGSRRREAGVAWYHRRGLRRPISPGGNGYPIMGGVDENRTVVGREGTDDLLDELPDLVVGGFALMGGLEIKG